MPLGFHNEVECMSYLTNGIDQPRSHHPLLFIDANVRISWAYITPHCSLNVLLFTSDESNDVDNIPRIIASVAMEAISQSQSQKQNPRWRHLKINSNFLHIGRKLAPDVPDLTFLLTNLSFFNSLNDFFWGSPGNSWGNSNPDAWNRPSSFRNKIGKKISLPLITPVLDR